MAIWDVLGRILGERIGIVNLYLYTKSRNPFVIVVYCQRRDRPSRNKKSTILSLILIGVFILLLPCTGLAATGDEYNDGTYVYTELSDGTLSVKGLVPTISCPSSIVIPSSCNGKAVTEIAKLAFYYGSNDNIEMHDIIHITIPASVKIIRKQAFSSCQGIESLTFAANSQLETIEDAAFQSSSLTSVTIPASVKNLSGFYYDVYLSTVIIEENSQLETIGRGAFYNCQTLTSFEIPAGVQTIGYNAFCKCAHLASVTFEGNNQLTSIGSLAFSTTALTTITLPKSVTVLDNSVFYNSTLKKIYLYNLDTTIGTNVFKDTPLIASDAPAVYGIYGYDDSVLETYAADNGIHFHPTYIVSYNSNGGTAVNSADVEPGNSTTAPTAPTKDGFRLEGWYKDSRR